MERKLPHAARTDWGKGFEKGVGEGRNRREAGMMVVAIGLNQATALRCAK